MLCEKVVRGRLQDLLSELTKGVKKSGKKTIPGGLSEGFMVKDQAPSTFFWHPSIKEKTETNMARDNYCKAIVNYIKQSQIQKLTQKDKSSETPKTNLEM